METSDVNPATARPAITVAVVIEREREPNRFEDWRFRIVDVVPNEAGFGSAPRVLRAGGKLQRTLHPGFRLELFRDQAEGYYLNLSTGAPVWFVVWRVATEDPSHPWPDPLG